MPKISVEKLEKWIGQGTKLLGSPIGQAVLGAIADRLPKVGFTEDQIAGMKARAEDARNREARARQRAGQ